MDGPSVGSARLRGWLVLFLAWAKRRLSSRTPSALVFESLLLFGVIYRTTTYLRLFSVEITPHSFVPGMVSLYGAPREFLADLVFAVLAAGVVWLPHRALRRYRKLAWVRALGWACLYLMMVVIGVLSGAHHDLVFEAHSGLTRDVLLESWSTSSLSDITSYATPFGRLCMVLPLALLILLRAVPHRWDWSLTRNLVVVAALILAGQLPHLARLSLGKNAAKRPAWELRASPTAFVIEDLLKKSLRAEGRYERQARSLAPFARRGTRPAHWESSSQQAILKKVTRPNAPDRDWNLVIVIMESTGSEYVFDATHAGIVPMPFLQRIANEGVVLQNHIANANSSPRAIFSLMSGLYGGMNPRMFCTRPDVVIPGLGSRLGASFDSFLVTPGRVQSYFPMAFMSRSVVSEIVDDLELPDSERESAAGGRHELDGVDYFVQRIETAKEPFLGIYYSYAPHTPYADHGPEYRITPGRTKRERYTNNLRLLDVGIQKIFRRLEETGRLERSVLLFVGDHGEAFGQHKGNWAHGRRSYQENFRVPAIFYQPKLFEPQRVRELTSHVDLAPTLLDAMGKPAPAHEMQGDSLFRPPVAEYRYAYGNEDTVSSLSRSGVKVQVRFGPDECVAFDLKLDPREKKQLSCGPFLAQLEDLLAFRNFQEQLLEQYNAEVSASLATR